MDQKISHRITFIGFVMTCVIVLFHCYDGQIEPVSIADEEIYNGINHFFSMASRLALCWFFSVSGFLLYREYDLSTYLCKVKRRIFSLLIPYLIWELSGGILNRSLLREPGRVLANIFLFQKWPPVGPLWYMYAIFLLALISPVIFYLLKWKKGIGGFILFALLAAIVYYNDYYKGPIIYHFLSYGYVKSIINYLPAYLTGCWFGIHARDNDWNPFSGCVLLLLVALLADTLIGGLFIETVYCMIPILMLYAFPVVPTGGRMRHLFNLSFLIYAIHSYPSVHLTPRIRELLQKITPESWVVNLGGRLIILPTVILLAAIIWLLLSLICPSVLRIISGGRVKPWNKNLRIWSKSK